jgi:hypothetical protein
MSCLMIKLRRTRTTREPLMKIIFMSKKQYLWSSKEPSYPNEKQKGSKSNVTNET